MTATAALNHLPQRFHLANSRLKETEKEKREKQEKKRKLIKEKRNSSSNNKNR